MILLTSRAQKKLGALFVVVMASLSALAIADQPVNLQVDPNAASLAFVPFKLDDLRNPETNQPYDPNEVIKFEKNGAILWTGTPTELLEVMNASEQHFTAIGQSLRDKGDVNLVELAKHANLFDLQYLESMGLRFGKLAELKTAPLAECRKFSLASLGVNSNTGAPFNNSEAIEIEGEGELSAEQFIDRLNEQNTFLCSLGFDLAQLSEGNSQNAVSAILAKRADLMLELGISKFHPTFHMTALNKVVPFADTVRDVASILDSSRTPSPQQIWDLQKKANAELPAAWQIPDLPNIPSPALPKRTDLKLLKRKSWNGINIGDRDIAAVYSNAWYEVRGQEFQKAEPGHSAGVELDVRGEGKAGAFMFANEINFVHGQAKLSAKPEGIVGTTEVKMLGQDIWHEDVNEKLAYTKEKPEAFKFEKNLEYSAQFMAGPVPVTVRASILPKMRIGYSYGLSILKLNGSLIPGASVSLEVLGGVGIKAISAGAGGRMTLLDTSIPLNGSVGMVFAKATTPSLSLTITSQFKYHYLDGRMFAYAEWPWVDCSVWPPSCWSSPKRVEKNILSWQGERGTRQVMNWGMDINPFGAKLHGDLLDQTDRSETEQLQSALTLDQRKVKVANLERSVIEKEAGVFAALQADLASDAARSVSSDYVPTLNSATTKNQEEYLRSLEELLR